MSGQLEVPIFPLPNVVHFPHTELRLHVFEPRYRQLVQDLEGMPQERRLIGMVVLKESGSKPGQPAIYPAGTAGLMVDVEPLPDGRSNIVLEGRFRFVVDREILTPNPYREASVRRVEEAPFDLSDPGVVTLHRELADTTRALALEIGERFPIDADEPLPDGAADLTILVNRLCAGLDLPVLHKLQLLSEPLPRRALNVLTVLRGRRRTLEMLRPYRHLAPGASLN